MSSARRLTGVAGRWSAIHPWLAISVWLGCVVVLLAMGHLVGTRQLADADQSVGQSGVAEHMISKDFARHAGEQVLFESSGLRVSAPPYRAAIKDVLTRIEATGLVTQIQSPLDQRFANQISANRQAALLQFQI